MTTFHYPVDLAARTEVAWPEDLPPDPLASHRPRLLEVAYQASMVRDEERPVRLRILLARPDEVGDDAHAIHVLRFDRTRLCDADELRRLAAASPYETAVVCVAPDDEAELRIWGVAWTGAQWLAPKWGGRSGPRIDLPRTVVHVGGPGRLAVHAGDRLLASLERGNIATLATDVFTSRWISSMFADARAEIVAAQDGAESPELTEKVLRKVTQQMLRRALWLVRASRHGGTLLFAETGELEPLLAGTLRAKYRFAEGEPRLRYRTLLGKLTRDVAHARASLTPERVLGEATQRIADVEAGIFELSRLVASLTQVDGATLLSKRFEIVAFGVEVVGGTSSPTRVRRAIDAEGVESVDDPEESVGTRHRAAYRFVHAHPNGLAIVVSQDGTVRFVAQVNGAVTYFEQYIPG